MLWHRWIYKCVVTQVYSPFILTPEKRLINERLILYKDKKKQVTFLTIVTLGISYRIRKEKQKCITFKDPAVYISYVHKDI